MSVVTTWMLNIPYWTMKDGSSLYDRVDQWLGSGGAGWYPTALRGRLSNSNEWGGSKSPQINLIGAAVNYFDVEAFKSFLLTLPWSYPDDVQLFVNGEWDDRFSVYEIREGQWTQLS